MTGYHNAYEKKHYISFTVKDKILLENIWIFKD